MSFNLRAVRRAWSQGMRWRPTVAMAVIGSVNNSMQTIQRMVFREEKTLPAPLFVIGHWRSGTTFLHELLSLDRRYTFPNTYECFYPSHFLLTERQFLRSDRASRAIKRPMDEVRISMTSPQEDEFALLFLGALSPYLWMFLPQRFDFFRYALDADDWIAQEREEWERVFRSFLRNVLYLRPGRPLLKSPTHTFRVGFLSRLFPGAQFIHIVRNPSHVFQSTLRMWRSLFDLYGLEEANLGRLVGQVLETGNMMEQALERDLRDLPARSYFRVRYEELVAQPRRYLTALYSHCGWAQKEEFLESADAYCAQRRYYAARSEEPLGEHVSLVRLRWHQMYEKYGYNA